MNQFLFEIKITNKKLIITSNKIKNIFIQNNNNK